MRRLISAGVALLCAGVWVHAQSAPGTPSGGDRVPAADTDTSVTVLLSADSVQPGDEVTAALSAPPGIEEVDAVLIAPNGKQVAREPGFDLDLDNDTTTEIVLLGVADTLPAGHYQIEFDGVYEKGGDFSVRRPLDVRPRDFALETIPLNAKLSDLRETPDPVKTAQARQYWQIISTFNDSDVYSTTSFAPPVTGYRVTAGFGDRRKYQYNDGIQDGTVHEGIDLAVPAGTPVHAAAAGKVVFADFWLETGNTVVLEHLPGLYSLYFHMSKLIVHAGDIVSQGQEIGLVGQTGLATGPHVHFEVRVGSVAVEPFSFMNRPVVDKEAILKDIWGSTAQQ